MIKFSLNRYKALFKNTDSFRVFSKILLSALKKDMYPIILDKNIIGYLLSEKSTKEFLYNRISVNNPVTMGRKGGLKSRRTLTPEQAKKMVKARERKKLERRKSK